MKIAAAEVLDLLEDPETDQSSGNERLRRRVRARVDYSQTPWMQMLQDAELRDPDSLIASSFRLRFRVPHPLFNYLMDLTRVGNYLSRANTDCTGRPAIPLELKVLAVLRVLSRGVTFDDAAELSGMSMSTVQATMHRWTEAFAQDQYHNWVKLPSTAAELSKVMSPYKAVGLPGAIGSVDVTHVKLGRAPSQMKFELTGKEGYASYGYQAIVSHDGLLLAACGGFHGATNDKTIVRMDPAMLAIRDRELYKSLPYRLRNLQGEEYDERGAYIICDGGYLQVCERSI